MLSTSYLLRARSAVALLAATIVLHPLAAQAAAAEGAESPAAVVDGLQAAAEAHDFPGLARLLAPDARAQITVSLVVGVSMMVAFAQMGGEMAGSLGEAFSDEDDAEQQAEVAKQQEEAAAMASGLQARLAGVFEKYGLGDVMDDAEGEDEAGPEKLTRALAGVDQPSLIGELLDIMSGLGESGPGEASPVPDGELENLAIDGDHATGTVNGEPAEFVRIDGRWYFSPPEPEI
jgi:hypothetical protein